MSEYWKRRAEAILVANEKSLLQYEKELKKAYEAAILNVKREVEAFYARYAEDNVIDLATARQRLNSIELKNFNTQAQIYLSEIDRLGLDPQYKEYLRKLSAKAYVTKLQEIETNIRHEIEKLTKELEKGLETELKNDYEDSFYKTLFEVQKQAGFGVNFTTPGNKQLDTAVRTKWLGSSFSDRIWNNKNALLLQLNQIIPQEFVRGRGPNEVAKTLADKLGTSFNNAVRLARTEMNNISNQATMDAYRKSEVVEEYEFLATLDNRTSDICRELDGKVFKLSQAQTGVNLPPMHPYCRSTTVPYFPEDEMSEPGDRIARDEHGNNYLVGKDVTFKEWAQNYAEASYVNRKYGYTPTPKTSSPQYERYKNVLKDLVPESYEEFEKLKTENPEKWKQLKAQYRALNRYEIPQGVNVTEVLELDKIAWETKQTGFDYSGLHGDDRKHVKGLRTAGNVGVLKVDNETYFSHSSVTKNDEILYNSYKGNYTFIDRPTTSIFKTKYLNDDIDRTYDTEYRFFDFLSKTYKPTDTASVTILSEKHICESCSYVQKQFSKAYPNITVNVISGKPGYNKDETGRKTFKYRNKGTK